MRFLYFLRRLGLRLWEGSKFIGYVAGVIVGILAVIAGIMFVLGWSIKLAAGWALAISPALAALPELAGVPGRHPMDLGIMALYFGLILAMVVAALWHIVRSMFQALAADWDGAGYDVQARRARKAATASVSLVLLALVIWVLL